MYLNQACQSFVHRRTSYIRTNFCADRSHDQVPGFVAKEALNIASHMRAQAPFGFAANVEVDKTLDLEAKSTDPHWSVEVLMRLGDAGSSLLGANAGGIGHGNSNWSGRSYVESHHKYSDWRAFGVAVLLVAGVVVQNRSSLAADVEVVGSRCNSATCVDSCA